MVSNGQQMTFTLPTFGKTGTANRFTNSSFVGFIPGPKGRAGHFHIQDGYVIASYVGYDDNRPMKGKHLAIYGASGALPLWVDTANAIANSGPFIENLQIADLAFDIKSVFGLNTARFQPVALAPITGFPQEGRDDGLGSEEGTEAYSDVTVTGGQRQLNRSFEPITGVYHEKTYRD